MQSQTHAIQKNLIKGFFYGLLVLCFNTSSLHAAPQSNQAKETQKKIKKLDSQIQALQTKLAKANNRYIVLNEELVETEKQIGESVNQLRHIHKDIQHNHQNISKLEHQTHQLSTQLEDQQKSLAKHLRSRYQMGEYQPLKWLISQNDTSTISRVMTYYQYLVKSRIEVMDKITQTQEQLNNNKKQLQAELEEKNQLQRQLKNQQEQLFEDKKYHRTLIENLDKDIKNKHLTLKEYQQNKENLSQILQQLSRQSNLQNLKPFYRMRRHLPRPIQSPSLHYQKMNQGLTFFAKEGTMVNAIYPGKVVFSDWLRGYGLLLIIDHGQGYMSLYAHNESLFKQKGEMVEQNEQIASVGHSGGIKENGLYFEIRHQGKAVSPLQWLS